MLKFIEMERYLIITSEHIELIVSGWSVSGNSAYLNWILIRYYGEHRRLHRDWLLYFARAHSYNSISLNGTRLYPDNSINSCFNSGTCIKIFLLHRSCNSLFKFVWCVNRMLMFYQCLWAETEVSFLNLACLEFSDIKQRSRRVEFFPLYPCMGAIMLACLAHFSTWNVFATRFHLNIHS